MSSSAEAPAGSSGKLVADLVVERLRAWDVPRVFGYSGDGINTVLGAMRRAGGDPEFVQARHEEAAAFMAVGHAKYTGDVGVVLSTQGPGAVHLLNGLYDAKLDSVPVVAIMGQQNRTVLGSGYMQEVDLPLVFADVAGFSQTAMTAEQVPMLLDRAFRTALATRGPCVVIIPQDVQQLPAPEPRQAHGAVVTAPRWAPGRVGPDPDAVRQAADVLAAGERVALLVGQGARHAWDEVVTIAERLGAGITTSLLGKPYVDEGHPLSAGVMGHLGTSASGIVLGECDTLLIVGSDDPWTEFYPPPVGVRAVQIDIDGSRLGNRYPIEVGVTGDAVATLRQLIEQLPERPSGPWRTRVEESIRNWHALAEERAALPAEPLNPEAVVRALTDHLPDTAQVAVDVGSIVYSYARQLRLPSGVPAHLSSTLASMGCSLPYALAAKLAAPDRPVVALSGDGAMQMLGLAELITVAARWREWADPRFVVLVLANQELAEVTWEQREMEGDPRYPASQALPAVPYAGWAELLGLTGIRIDDPAEIDSAWRRAMAADRPVLIEAVVDRDVPLLPPFPAGRTKLDPMRAGLTAEGEPGRHGLELLDAQAEQEERLGGSS